MSLDIAVVAVAKAMGRMVVALVATVVVNYHWAEPEPAFVVTLLWPTRAKGIDAMIIGDFHRCSNDVPQHGVTVEPAVKIPGLYRSISFDARSAANDTLPFRAARCGDEVALGFEVVTASWGTGESSSPE